MGSGSILPCSLKSSIIDYGWILLSTSTACYDMLFYLKYTKEIQSYTDLELDFLNNRRYSLILHQNLTRGSFLKVSCSVESESLSVKFLYCFKTKNKSSLHSIYNG